MVPAAVKEETNQKQQQILCPPRSHDEVQEEVEQQNCAQKQNKLRTVECHTVVSLPDRLHTPGNSNSSLSREAGIACGKDASNSRRFGLVDSAVRPALAPRLPWLPRRSGRPGAVA